MSVHRIAPLTLIAMLLAPASAFATTPHAFAAVPIAGVLGDIFGGIGHALLGAFSWTIGLATKFILTTIAALVKMLIPHSWVHQGLQIMQWIVAIPNYAGRITSPGGGTSYGFGGINALRDVFMWLGIAIAPLTLVYATSRAMIGESDPVGIPLLRMLAVAAVIVSYPYWWGQAAALADQVTNSILSVPEVTQGLYKLMDYAVDGVALGGWQLIDLGLMGAIALELLGLIFLKVVLILLGALLYATGPLSIGLVPTRAGGALARAWTSAVVTLLGIGIAWATLFAVGALLIGDASTAGPLIAGNSAFGSLGGGLLLAVAGLASLWLCLKVAKEAGSLLRLQLSGLLVLAGSHGHSASSSAAAATRARTSGSSLRNYGSRLARAAGAANGELALAGVGGAGLAGTARTAASIGRRGLVGTAATGLRTGASAVTGPGRAALGHTRAGAVASRMARAGTASWMTHSGSAPPKPGQAQRGASRTGKPGPASRPNGGSAPSITSRTSQTRSSGSPSSTPSVAGQGNHASGRSGHPIGYVAPRDPTPADSRSARPAAGPADGTNRPARPAATGTSTGVPEPPRPHLPSSPPPQSGPRRAAAAPSQPAPRPKPARASPPPSANPENPATRPVRDSGRRSPQTPKPDER